jgi:hypothetical protein
LPASAPPASMQNGASAPAEATPKPADPVEEIKSNPVEEAAQASILKQQVLAMDRADAIQREHMAEQQRLYEEQVRAAQEEPELQEDEPQEPAQEQVPPRQEQPSGRPKITREQVYEVIDSWKVPERLKDIFRNYPQWVVNRQAMAEIKRIDEFTLRAVGGERHSPQHLAAMERFLFGSAGEATSNGASANESQAAAPEPSRPQPPPPPTPKPAPQPQRQQAPAQHQKFSPALPPSRESISVKTGRPVGGSIQLSGLEREIARSNANVHDGMTQEEKEIEYRKWERQYAIYKAQMLEMKANGGIQGDHHE